MKKFFNLSVLLTVLPILMSCKGEDVSTFMEKTKRNSQKIVLGVKNYDYKGLVDSASNEIDTVTRSRIALEYNAKFTTGETNLENAYFNVISYCKDFANVLGIKAPENQIAVSPCSVTYKKVLKQGMGVAPEYEVSVVLPEDYVDKMVDYVKALNTTIAETEVKKAHIENDILLNEMELESAKLLKQNIAVLQSRSDAYNLDETKALEKYATKVNRKISTLENNITFLYTVKNKARINLKLERKYNSSSSMFKNQMKKCFVYFLNSIDYILYFFIILFLFWGTGTFFDVIKKTLSDVGSAIKNIKIKKKTELEVKKDKAPSFGLGGDKK